jgi:uncharacterized lipoprotein YmbA
MNRSLFILAGALSLAACSSPPVHYHTLSAPVVANAQAVAFDTPFAIEVLPVGIPAQLDQERLVVRQDAGGLVIQDGERWSGPYADEIRNALAVQLAGMLQTQDVTGLGKSAGQAVMRVQVQVRRFDAWIGDKVSFEATWRLGLAGATDSARLLCTSRFDVPARGGYPELVQAQQQAVARLATSIATSARAWNGATGGSCTK